MNMSGESLLVITIVGVVAGWPAGQIVRGVGFGRVGDLLIGIVGAFITAGHKASARRHRLGPSMVKNRRKQRLACRILKKAPLL